MRNNYTNIDFDVDIELSLNTPMMFTQIKHGKNKGTFHWIMIRKGDVDNINWREKK